jgi:two-component system phosphate regulon response regulator OmpR
MNDSVVTTLEPDLTESGAEALRERFSRPVVLIIDDDATARLALAAMISPDEFELVFATDAADARSRMALIDPDLIICDLVMKEMCGDELFRWLQSDPRWSLVPVICVTRLDNTVVRTDLLRSGADAVLVKPCNGKELRAQVQVALRTRWKYLRLALRETP